MVKSQRYESEDRPPKTDHLRGEIAALHTEVACQTDQPITTDGLQKDLVESWNGLLLVDELLDGSEERVRIKDSTVYMHRLAKMLDT